MSAIVLSECWDATALKNDLMTNYNGLSGVENPLTEAEATAIVTLCKVGLGALWDCDTVYSTAGVGTAAIRAYLGYVTFPLVTEIRNQIFALNNDMGKEHSQIKFNPVNNADIEKGTVATDDTRFNYAQNMLTNVDFLIKNNKALQNFLSYIKKDTLLVI